MTDQTADFALADHGSVWIFTPLTDVARSHLDSIVLEIEADGSQVLMWGKGLAVEHRFVPDFAERLESDGFTLAPA